MSPIHFIVYASHHDVESACGLSAFGWEQPDDPEGTVGGDSNGARVYFAKEGEAARVTCPGCRPKAEEAIERRRRYEADAITAGGLDAYHKKIRARVHEMLGRKHLGPDPADVTARTISLTRKP